MKPIGISILTNGNRRRELSRCLDSFLANCYYRPLVIGIFDNGSTDDTWSWMRFLSNSYCIEYRTAGTRHDGGCAYGTNRSIGMVDDCEYQIHLESDFEHLTEAESGMDKMWLHRAVELMDSGDCDYLYLRRMRGPDEAAMHWWDQWMPQVTEERGEFLRCPPFWWSNNPTLFRHSKLYGTGIERYGKVLPLDEEKDGRKGTIGWSQPELKAGVPSNSWIHRWGMFVHERQPDEIFKNHGCGKDCKYGFWMSSKTAWCARCDETKDFRDLVNHRRRVGG